MVCANGKQNSYWKFPFGVGVYHLGGGGGGGAGSPSHNASRMNYIINRRLSCDLLVVSGV